jgi:hypothetical protein
MRTLPIALFLWVPFSSAFVPCGPSTLNSLQIRRTHLCSSCCSTSSFIPAFHKPPPRNSIRNAFPSIRWEHALQMSDVTNEKTCKLAVGDQVRVLVKTITLAKSAVQAGTWDCDSSSERIHTEKGYCPRHAKISITLQTGGAP